MGGCRMVCEMGFGLVFRKRNAGSEGQYEAVCFARENGFYLRREPHYERG